MYTARTEAQRLHSEFIGTEHILLGIVQECGGVAAKVLKNLSVDFKRVRQEIERLLQPNPTPSVTLGDVPLSPRAKRVLELAQESAGRLGQDVIGTDHLLLALLKEGEGIAAMVLQKLGVRSAEVEEAVKDLVGCDPIFGNPAIDREIKGAIREELAGACPTWMDPALLQRRCVFWNCNGTRTRQSAARNSSGRRGYARKPCKP
jgi:ATP-dependent Clp protease ATP-binding subunit ClpA